MYWLKRLLKATLCSLTFHKLHLLMESYLQMCPYKLPLNCYVSILTLLQTDHCTTHTQRSYKIDSSPVGPVKDKKKKMNKSVTQK